MPRRCTVCDHPKRAEIDRAIVSQSESYRAISHRVGVSRDALMRHADDHVSLRLAKAADAKEAAAGDKLLDEVRTLHKAAQHILARGLEAKDYRTALGAIREARGTLELLAKLLGELREATTNVNVLVSPEWQQVQAVILAVLAPHPALRYKMAKALSELSSDAA